MATATLSPIEGRYRKTTQVLRKNDTSISPVDGMFKSVTSELAEIMGERSLAANRIRMEGEHLIFLSKQNLGMRALSKNEISTIRKLYDVTDADVDLLKDIEFRGWAERGIKATNHDVKAVEYFMREKLKDTSLADVLNWTHFALTSEDTNSIAIGLMLKDALNRVIMPTLDRVSDALSDTIIGRMVKEGFDYQVDHLGDTPILVKLNGAVGNYNAHSAAFPAVTLDSWLKFTSDFVSGLNDSEGIQLKPNLITTQIEPHDNYADIFNTITRANSLLVKYSRICEGDDADTEMIFSVANALNNFFASKLPISRLQRDLSDSTVERNFGTALAYSQIGYSLLLDSMKDVFHVKQTVEKKDADLSYELKDVMIPRLCELRDAIYEYAERHADIPILARTHGQPAMPTTFGKELHVFGVRMATQIRVLETAFDETDNIGGAARMLDTLRSFNTILVDFDQDMWRYISDGWLKLNVVEGEVGSSTMPQKVNPINFENSEGNAGIANVFLASSSSSLLLWGEGSAILQGNIMEGLSHSLIAVDAALKGLGKISVNTEKVTAALQSHVEILAEGIQTILRRAGSHDAYEQVKALTRGDKQVTADSLHKFIVGLEIDPHVKRDLLELDVMTYTGKASELVHHIGLGRSVPQ